MPRSVCYVATYHADYSRNLDMIRALRAAGVRVEVVRPRLGQNSPGASPSALSAVRSGLLQLVGAPRRAIEMPFRLLRCRALIVGYFGQLDMLLLAPIARAMGRPVIFNPLVTLTDTLVEDRKLLPAGSPSARLIGMIDRLSLHLADLVLVDTSENAAYIAGISGSRTLVFPVGVDETVFYPSDCRSEKPRGKLDVLFYGTYIPLHGVETIVRAAAILNRSHAEIEFELIGSGQDYARARHLAIDLDATNIRWTDWLPYSGLGNRLREADVALGVFDGGEKASRVIPNKVHQALACATPVVTRTSPAALRLLNDEVSALLVPPDDPEALASALVKLADSPELRRGIGLQGRQAWEAFASGSKLAEIAGIALDRVGVSR